MKRTNLILAGFTLLLLSCNETPKQQQAQEAEVIDSTISEDTTNGFDAQASDSKQISEVTPHSRFTSPDRQLHDLAGNVKKVAIYSIDTEKDWQYVLGQGDWGLIEYEFDQKGMIKRTDIHDDYKYIRNDNNVLVKKEKYISDFGISISEEFQYDENGSLTKKIINGLEWVGNEIYEYDHKGNCISVTRTAEGEGIYRYNVTEQKFDYISRDNQGNWTKRYITNTEKNGSSLDKFDEESTYYTVEIREISYY